MTGPLSRSVAAGLLAAAIFASGMGIGSRHSGADVAVCHVPPASAPEDAVQPQTTTATRTPRGRDDAIRAAAAFVTMFDGAVLFDEVQRAALLDDAAAGTARRRLTDELDMLAERVGDALGIGTADLGDELVVWRSVPAGARLDDFGPDRAVVSIWGTGVVIVPSVPLAQPGWRTTRVEMTWERDAWRLVGYRSEPGPEPPTVGGTPSAVGQARLIHEFKPLPFATPSRSGP